MDDLSAFQRDILYAVYGSDGIHGLGIKEEIEEYYVSEMNHGRLYPNLDKLSNRGLIEKRDTGQQRNEYRLTKKARRLLEERRKWENEEAQELLGD